MRASTHETVLQNVATELLNSCFVVGRSQVHISVRTKVTLAEDFHDFPHSL
jgi:hypothetical protein